MKSVLFSLLALAFLCLPFDALAAEKPQKTPADLALIAVGTVVEMPKPDQIKLDNQKIYTLDNIRIPFQYNDSVKDLLKTTIIGKKVGIYVPRNRKDSPRDSYGNIPAHIMTENAKWVQALIVSNGFAYVYSAENNPDLVRSLYKFEDTARKNLTGLWNDPVYAVKSIKTISEYYSSFQIFEGSIRLVKREPVNRTNAASYTYVYFEDPALKGFKIKINNNTVSTIQGYLGRNRLDQMIDIPIRVRGWVENEDGPTMELKFPEQLEIIATASAAKQP